MTWIKAFPLTHLYRVCPHKAAIAAVCNVTTRCCQRATHCTLYILMPSKTLASGLNKHTVKYSIIITLMHEQPNGSLKMGLVSDCSINMENDD